MREVGDPVALGRLKVGKWEPGLTTVVGGGEGGLGVRDGGVNGGFYGSGDLGGEVGVYGFDLGG